ncbi:uncharacterized protein TNCV_2369601 [Trichonephila clavipes]|nr:uncharacterized protein TNCV_2369601 [Trichonephila clavipes]
MVWGAIVYNAQSRLVFIRGPMTAQRYILDILTILGLIRQEYRMTVSALLIPFLGLLDPKFFSNRAYLNSFETASWTYHLFERIRGKGTAKMERNVSGHHTEQYASILDRIASCIRAREGSTGYPTLRSFAFFSLK